MTSMNKSLNRLISEWQSGEGCYEDFLNGKWSAEAFIDELIELIDELGSSIDCLIGERETLVLLIKKNFAELNGSIKGHPFNSGLAAAYNLILSKLNNQKEKGVQK